MASDGVGTVAVTVEELVLLLEAIEGHLIGRDQMWRHLRERGSAQSVAAVEFKNIRYRELQQKLREILAEQSWGC